MNNNALLLKSDAAAATFFWLLGVTAIASVAAGAWWHLFTAAGCIGMSALFVLEIVAILKIENHGGDK